MQTTISITLIATNSTVRGGRPYLIGTTITVADIATAKIFHRLEPEEIAENYKLTLPQVYAALAYYYDHKSEIDASIQDRRQLAAEMKEQRVGSRHKPLFR
ncbi:MAG TPA: DUF433 domain-containing protein [Aggregatilineaceae bacterium]|nr:DUF433 domain-containing protein [Aggregatilineaceae bacterium]